MKIFTIIKGVSERVPSKNFRLISGVPLWYYSLAKFRDYEVFINTDCPELFDTDLLKRLPNLTLIRRERKHVDWENRAKESGSPVEDMLYSFLEQHITDDHEPIVLTHVTSPFLSSETLRRASEDLGHGFRSVHSVKRLQDFAFMVNENNSDEIWQPVNFDPRIVARTQDLQPIYVSNGAFFIVTKFAFSPKRRRLVPPVKFFELTAIEALEIDYEDDFILANLVSKALA